MTRDWEIVVNSRANGSEPFQTITGDRKSAPIGHHTKRGRQHATASLRPWNKPGFPREKPSLPERRNSPPLVALFQKSTEIAANQGHVRRMRTSRPLSPLQDERTLAILKMRRKHYETTSQNREPVIIISNSKQHGCAFGDQTPRLGAHHDVS